VASSETDERFWNIPNALSISRLALAAVAWGLIARSSFAAALVVFSIAAITDALDGFVARLLKQESDIGRQLDPLVDKILIIGTLVYLLTIPGTGVMPWMVAAITTRELAIQWVRSLLEGRGIAFGAKASGKLKTVFQCLAVVAVLLVSAVGVDRYPQARIARDALLWIAVLQTLYSGIVYAIIAAPRLKETR
jgi:CDP-diacylglycerol--glycerol-3-phosphate 3-phosphatidyltransferase